MNRYHFGFLFSMAALVLFFTVSLRSDRITMQQKADRDTRETLRFAVSCATNVLDSDYGDADDPGQISTVFFKSLAAMEDGRSLLNGRISPEDFYPYVPVLVYLQERDYYIGYYDGSSYVWTKCCFDENETLSTIPQNELLVLLEQEINLRLSVYHDNCHLPDKEYVLPDSAARNPKSGTLLVVLENFPTILDGYYYSGVLDGSGAISED